MIARGLLPMLAIATMGASPIGSFSMAQPMPDFSNTGRRARPVAPPGAFTAAPLPNHEAAAPRQRASTDASVAPGFFNRHDQYRGEGISASDSAQTEQERHVRPGAGINLSMPLQ